MSFEWLSLDDFVEEIRKSLHNNDLNKADIHVTSYTKDVGGQRFRVRDHQRHVINSTPEMGHGHVKHFIKPEEPTDKLGGLAAQNESDVVPVVPVKKEKKPMEPLPEHPYCSNCSPTKAAPESDGSPSKFKYAPPKLPIEGKTYNDITLNDIAGSLHKHRHLNAEQWKSLPFEEQEAHVKNNNMIHLNDDAKAALKSHVHRLVRGYMERNLERFQLGRLGVDPEQAVDFFSNRIINEMKAHYRAGQEHNYVLNGTKEYEGAKKSDIPVKRLFHQGIDPNKVMTGKDLEIFIRAKANKNWPLRIINKELPTGYTKTDSKGEEVPQHGYEEMLSSPAIIAQNKKMGEARKIQTEMDKISRQQGVGEMSIDPTASYDLKDLENIATKNGYVLEQHASPDGSQMHRIVISDYSGDTPQPVGEIDFTKGGKISDLRDKLASIVNPKQESKEPTPFKKFQDVSKQYDEIKEKTNFVRKDYEEAKERYDRLAVPPEEHLKSIEGYSSSAINVAEGLVSELNGKPEMNMANQILTRVVDATEQTTQTKDFKRAETQLKDALQAAKELATKSPNAQALVMAITKLKADVDAYKQKASIPESQLESKLEDLFDKYKDKEDQLTENETKLSGMKSDIGELASDPNIANYLELKRQHDQLQNELEELKPTAQAAWNQFEHKSLQEPGEGKEGDINSNFALEGKASLAASDNMDASDREWYDKIPEDINLDDEDEANEAAKKLLEAYKHVHHPGELIFGENPNVAKGIVHVADHYMNHTVKNLAMEYLSDMDKKYPREKGIVPPFLQGENMSVLRRAPVYWGRLFSLSPKIVAHYALKFSDYATIPYNTKDVMENEVKDENGKPYFNVLMSDIAAKMPKQKNLSPVVNDAGQQIDWKLKPQHEWKGMPDSKVFEIYYFKLLHEFGNAAVKYAMSKKPEIAPVMEMMRELNHAPKKMQHASAEKPGTLRRDLQRRMDVIYGQTFGKFPDWHHKLSPEEEQGWLNKVRNTTSAKSEKSLVIYEEVLRKAVKLIIKI